jgi:dTDP-4-dehydrorhamnose 3,5-epimerase-like enzyme
MIRTKSNPRIETKAKDASPNGFLIPIFNVHDDFVAEAQYPKQVYLTVVAPRAVKGPHLHLKRWGLFTCVRGNVKIVARTSSGYEEYFSGENHGFATVQIPAGVPSALVNLGDEDAYVLNMPAPSWHKDDQDDHPVSFADIGLP